MAARLPLVRIAGRFRQLPSGDYVPVGAGGTGVGTLADLKTALSVDKVSNTADADKPVSTAQQSALDSKASRTNAVLDGAKTIFSTEIVQHSPGSGISAGYEIGSTAGAATTPYLDFHSGAIPTDYDFRLLFSGGDGTAGKGNASFNGAAVTFNCLSKFTSPVEYPNYTLSTLPSASANNTRIINVSNATGGQKLCQSNGTVWQILNTTTTVS